MAASSLAVVRSGDSFFSRVKTELKKLFSHAPGWEASASATLTYVAPMVEVVVGLADPAAAPVVDALIAKVQSAMAAAAVVVKDAGPTPTLLTYLSAISNDLAQVESAAGVKDPETAAKLKSLIRVVVGEVNAIAAEVSAAK